MKPVTLSGLQPVASEPAVREICERCRRPRSVCYCARLPVIASSTRVVLLQHPREAKVPIGTARMTHLGLANSELHHGVSFDDHPRVAELLATPALGAALLFPGEGASALEDLPPGALKTLVVIDGTWSQARKVWQRSKLLQQLPRIAFTPARPGNYRIRREPEAHFVSTIEAVVEILGRLEHDPERFAPLLAAFDYMVDLQIDHARGRLAVPRRRVFRRPPRDGWFPKELSARYRDLVLVYAEANTHPRETEPPLPSELVHLVGLRPSSGEQFVALLAPRVALAPSTPHHIGVSREKILAGEGLGAALGRFRTFLGPDALLCGWGGYPLDLLEHEGEARRPFLDLRLVLARKLKRRPGAVESVAETLAAPPVAPFAEGRAGVRLAALARVLQAIVVDPPAGISSA